MGEENITKYAGSTKNIEGGTNIFPPNISGYEVQLCKIKTYYNGNIRDERPDEEYMMVGMETSDRVAITIPKSSDTYVVEFIYKKSNTVSTTNNDNIENWTEESNLEDNEENNSIKEDQNTDLFKINDTKDESINTTNDTTNKNNNINANINNSKSLNNTITNNQELPKTGENNIINFLIIISIIFFIVSFVMKNTYREI